MTVNQFLEQMYSLLIKDAQIKKVYNTEDNENDITTLDCFSDLTKIDWHLLWSKFCENIIYLKEYIDNTSLSKDDNKNKILSVIFDMDILEIQGYNCYDISDNYKILLIKVQNMLTLFAVTATSEHQISDLIDSDLTLLYEQKENTFFRGESDFSYKLIPSIYRDLDVKKVGPIIQYQQLFDLYYKYSNLVDKYNDIFSFKKIDYNFCAYMQHAKSYSPFLDLTKNILVALSFSTHVTGGLNQYLKCDSSVYEINFAKDINREDIQLDEIDIFYVDGRLRMSSVIRGVLLCYCSYKNFDVDVAVLSRQMNDRMRYQSGSFLWLNKCVIVNGILLLPVNMGKIKKYKITPNISKKINKMSIYNTIKSKYRKYDFEHLLDPYLYFEEAPL